MWTLGHISTVVHWGIPKPTANGPMASAPSGLHAQAADEPMRL